MPADAILYSCKSPGIPNAINSLYPYCIVRGGHRRMSECCREMSDGLAYLQPDCYSWCHIRGPFPKKNDASFEDLVGSFSDCLARGQKSDDDIPEMVCGPGFPVLDGRSPHDKDPATGSTPHNAESTSSSGQMGHGLEGRSALALLYGLLFASVFIGQI